VPWHAFRKLGSGQEATRVALDGCIYGPRTTTRTAILVRWGAAVAGVRTPGHEDR